MAGNAPTDDAVGLMFFNQLEYRTVAAVAARIIPSEPDGLGAREAGAAIYIDRALAGYFRDQQSLYRQALQMLNTRCRRDHSLDFDALDPKRQDAMLAAIDAGTEWEQPGGRSAEDAMLARFFALIREHTIQGMFCDPMYGGNCGFVGWRMIGFPGAQWEYSAEQMRPGFDAAAIPIQSLADLRRQRGDVDG